MRKLSITNKINKLLNEANCGKVNSIEDINKQYKYTDEYPGGKRDDEYVACGQSGSHNELEYIYNNYLKALVDDDKFTEQEVLRALCEVCTEMTAPRKRQDFYRRLGEKLNIEIPG